MTPNDDLRLTVVRSLDLREHPDAGRSPHISAASGVVGCGDFLHVIGDDELGIGVFRLSDHGPGSLAPVLSGTLPSATSTARRSPSATSRG